jgi:hypothetical protein
VLIGVERQPPGRPRLGGGSSAAILLRYDRRLRTRWRRAVPTADAGLGIGSPTTTNAEPGIGRTTTTSSKLGVGRAMPTSTTLGVGTTARIKPGFGWTPTARAPRTITVTAGARIGLAIRVGVRLERGRIRDVAAASRTAPIAFTAQIWGATPGRGSPAPGFFSPTPCCVSPAPGFFSPTPCYVSPASRCLSPTCAVIPRPRAIPALDVPLAVWGASAFRCTSALPVVPAFLDAPPTQAGAAGWDVLRVRVAVAGSRLTLWVAEPPLALVGIPVAPCPRVDSRVRALGPAVSFGAVLARGAAPATRGPVRTRATIPRAPAWVEGRRGGALGIKVTVGAVTEPRFEVRVSATCVLVPATDPGGAAWT